LKRLIASIRRFIGTPELRAVSRRSRRLARLAAALVAAIGPPPGRLTDG
jgi:hypothetical protein